MTVDDNEVMTALEPSYVMNELLAYMFCYFDADHSEDLKMSVNNFYTSDAVIVAKTLLWQHYGASLPHKVNRTNRGTKTPKQKNVEDIIDGIKVLDETVDTLPVQFCAINLNNLPAKCAPENPSDMRTRISTLESQMTEMLSFKQHTLKNNGNYQSEWPNIPVGSHQRSHQRQVHSGEGMTSPMQARTSDSECLQPNNRHMESDAGGSTDDTTKKVTNQQMNRNGLKDGQHTVTDDGSSKQKEGWKTYYKRNSVYGKRKSNEKNKLTIKGAPRRYQFVVFNVDKSVELNALKDYINTNVTTVLDMSRLSKEEWNRQSYRVLVLENDRERVMDNENCPENIGIRPYIQRKIESSGPSNIV